VQFSADLKQIYGAVNKDAAQQVLETFSGPSEVSLHYAFPLDLFLILHSD